jgi:energy-coupling factor transport system substrate-specific component
MTQVLRFLLLGGTAAAINWIVRFPLSLFMPFPAAVFFAYLIGMTAGFTLYRAYVFPGSPLPLRVQLGLFLAVNAVGAVIVMGVSVLLLDVAFPALGGVPFAEALAHGTGIGVGAVANFVGHKYLTFRVTPFARARAAPSLRD